ncbi:WXG100 family type VII secretion target [Actinomycetospora sp. CA-053990]|uniref:WXG100 family type VII secretion target n=1 Tax=Actinomycetospora sp. CA-053990 TaxID=3239891 RepID=UPI003D944871
MAELGETTDPAALVPGDPVGIRTVRARMARLGAALVGAGDGLRRIDTGDWQGEAADSFRRVFEPVPPLWTGTGEAFLEAADALARYADVLEGARDEAATSVQGWSADPVAAVDRLRAARIEVLTAGDRAATLVGRARDLAPPAPSVAQQLGGFLGDLAGGAWSEISATGQFLWQVNPTRFLVEPAAAAQGWQDLGSGVAHAVTHPAETVAAALNPREAATNPTRWAGEMLTGAGLSALGGAGAAGRIERATRAAGAVPPGSAEDATPGTVEPAVGTWGGLTARQHALSKGEHIGRLGSAKKMKIPVREVDTVTEVEEIYRALSEGGQRVQTSGDRTVVLLEDGTYMTYRRQSSTPPYEPAVDINPGDDTVIRIHTPRQEPG